MQRTIFKNQNIPLLILVIFNLIIGAIYIKDYGLSWDEPSRFRDAEKSLATYLGEAKKPTGRLYLVISKVGANAVNAIFHNWTTVESWHYFNFIYFQLSIIFFYMISLRFFDRWVTLATTLLYASQPVLWGHAFINPKDIPFTMYFLGGLAFGLKAVDLIASRHKGNSPLVYPQQELSLITAQVKKDWFKLSAHRRKIICWLIIISLGLLVLLLALMPAVGSIINYYVTQAAQGETTNFISRWIIKIAENLKEIPPEVYAQKAVKFYMQQIKLYGFFVVLLILTMGILIFHQTLGVLWKNEIYPFIKDSIYYFKDWNIWVAGFCIGMATSVRVLGPTAWLLLIGYLVLKFKRKTIPYALALLEIAIITMVLSWPKMWSSPFEAVDKSLTQAVDFPWEHTVIFAGIEYPADQLPRSYLPVLLSLQITEPALLLFFGGVGLVISGLKKHRIEWQMAALFGCWFFVPVIGVVIFHPTIYDNFRHFTFILPAIFLFGGICLSTIFQLINNSGFKSIIICLCMLPSIYALISLHPYQYIYYNSITGGVAGASRIYELDYWATSYREAADYINRIAPLNTRVIVWGPGRVAKYYCRPDMDVRRSLEEWAGNESNVPIYAIISTRRNKDMLLYPDAPVKFWVERNGARLVVVKQLSP